MKKDTFSKTAQYMALFRAVESAKKIKDKLFDDDYAIAFLDNDLKTVVKASRLPCIGVIVQDIINHKGPGAFNFRNCPDEIY